METPGLPADDLNELERRLSTWQPSTAGLAPEAMLFAAGRASVRGGKARLAWPVGSACLALAVVALGVWLAAERSQRRALLAALHQRPAEPAAAFPPVPDEKPTTEPPAPDSYLNLRREWERDSGSWAIRPAAPRRAPKRPASPERPILRAWQPGGPSEPL
jgi:hypothetical protein